MDLIILLILALASVIFCILTLYTASAAEM